MTAAATYRARPRLLCRSTSCSIHRCIAHVQFATTGNSFTTFSCLHKYLRLLYQRSAQRRHQSQYDLIVCLPMFQTDMGLYTPHFSSYSGRSSYVTRHSANQGSGRVAQIDHFGSFVSFWGLPVLSEIRHFLSFRRLVCTDWPIEA